MNRNILGLLTILLLGCGTHEIEKKEHPKTNANIQNRYSKKDLIGDWIFFHAEFVKGNKSDRNPLISKKNFVDDDSLIVSLEANGHLKINDSEIGLWSLKNDSLFLSGSRAFKGFPLFLDTKYEVHKGNLSKNWYFYCTFYSNDRKIHHTVKYRALKRGSYT